MQLNAYKCLPCITAQATTPIWPRRQSLGVRYRSGIITQIIRAMKITVVLLLMFCIGASARGIGQRLTISEHNVPLRQVFRQIEQQTGYQFFFSDEDLRGTHAVTLQARDMALSDVLDRCMTGQPIDYELTDKTVVIRRKKTVPPSVLSAILQSVNVIANEVKQSFPDIHGRVTDSTGKPMGNVIVSVKGTNQVTITDDNGNYSLVNVDPAKAVLVFSFVGYATQEIALNGRNEVSIILKELPQQLEDVGVMVNTGYQTLPKERATGSFTQIDNKLFNRTVSSDLLAHLQGVTNGLLFDPKAGNANGITVRGKSTIYSGTSPLIVVDNFPYVGEISNLNPNDVESVTVLKDAAAASIWGTAAGNGVIVITTKSGKLNQKAKLGFTSNLTIGGKPDLNYQPQLSSAEYISVEQYLFNKGYYNSNINTGYTTISPAVQIMLDRRNGVISSADSASRMDALAGQDVRKDLDKYFYRNSVIQQYNLNVSGGGPSQTYFLSAGYDKNLSNTVGQSNDRVTINANNSYGVFNNKLRLSADIVFSKANTKDYKGLMPFSVDYPYEQFADANGNALYVASSRGLNLAYTDTAGGGLLLPWGFSPLDELRNKYNQLTQSTTDFRANTAITYQVFPFLTASVNYQYYQSVYNQLNDYTQNSFYTRNRINSLSQINWATSTVTRPLPLGDILNRSNSDSKSQYGRAQLSFDKTFLGKHAVSAIAGYEVRQDKSSQNYNNVYGYDPNSATGVDVDNLTYFPYYYGWNVSRIASGIVQNYSENRNRSYYGNIGYVYDQRYIFTGSLRRDESNLFGVSTNQKGVPLGSIGIGWNADKEVFYHIGWLPHLKLTATYGFNGLVNNTISALLTSTYYGVNAWGSPSYSIVNPPNPSLRWEKVKNMNLGIEFSLKENILSGTVEYYIKNGEDLIGTSPIAPQTGITSFTGNSANTHAHGWDIQLNSHNLKSGLFDWGSTLILNVNKNKITAYKVNPGTNADVVGSLISPIEDYPINSIWAYKWAGLDGEGNPQGYLDGSVSEDYSSLTNSFDTSALVFKGSASPTVFGSLRNEFSYKWISLSFNILYKFGYYLKRSSLSYAGLFGGNYQQADYAKRWQQAGDEKTTDVPSLIYPANSNRDNFYNQSEVAVMKGDHVRLQDVRLAFNMDRTFFKKLPFSSASVYLYASNLGILWRANHYNLDPDFTSGYPMPKTLSIGCTVTF